jgi:hypothetical protein
MLEVLVLMGGVRMSVSYPTMLMLMRVWRLVCVLCCHFIGSFT